MVGLSFMLSLGDVGLGEGGLPGHAGLVGIALRELHHVGVVLDAVGGGAALGGGDHCPSVARAQVDHMVAGADLGHIQHLVHQRLRRRQPDDILTLLAELRLVVRRGLLGQGRSRHQRQTDCSQQANE
jgi:hypothetical protein